MTVPVTILHADAGKKASPPPTLEVAVEASAGLPAKPCCCAAQDAPRRQENMSPRVRVIIVLTVIAVMSLVLFPVVVTRFASMTHYIAELRHRNALLSPTGPSDLARSAVDMRAAVRDVAFEGEGTALDTGAPAAELESGLQPEGPSRPVQTSRLELPPAAVRSRSLMLEKMVPPAR